jgi:hypothetical protein
MTFIELIPKQHAYRVLQCTFWKAAAMDLQYAPMKVGAYEYKNRQRFAHAAAAAGGGRLFHIRW